MGPRLQPAHRNTGRGRRRTGRLARRRTTAGADDGPLYRNARRGHHRNPGAVRPGCRRALDVVPAALRCLCLRAAGLDARTAAAAVALGRCRPDRVRPVARHPRHPDRLRLYARRAHRPRADQQDRQRRTLRPDAAAVRAAGQLHAVPDGGQLPGHPRDGAAVRQPAGRLGAGAAHGQRKPRTPPRCAAREPGAIAPGGRQRARPAQLRRLRQRPALRQPHAAGSLRPRRSRCAGPSRTRALRPRRLPHPAALHDRGAGRLPGAVRDHINADRHATLPQRPLLPRLRRPRHAARLFLRPAGPDPAQDRRTGPRPQRTRAQAGARQRPAAGFAHRCPRRLHLLQRHARALAAAHAGRGLRPAHARDLHAGHLRAARPLHRARTGRRVGRVRNQRALVRKSNRLQRPQPHALLPRTVRRRCQRRGRTQRLLRLRARRDRGQAQRDGAVAHGALRRAHRPRQPLRAL